MSKLFLIVGLLMLVGALILIMSRGFTPLATMLAVLGGLGGAFLMWEGAKRDMKEGCF